jgi:hypothetical protein
VYIGHISALNCDGDDNTFIGKGTGGAYTGVESDNILIGLQGGVLGDNQKIRIGFNQTNTFIKGINGVTPALSTETVIVDSNGEMGSKPWGYAEYYMQNNTTDTPLTLNTWAIIGGTRQAGLASTNFTVDTVGTPDLEYIGTPNVVCRVNASFCWENDSTFGTTTINVQAAIFKNGTQEDKLTTQATLDENSAITHFPRNVSLTGLITMSTGDTLNVRVRNTSDGDDILVRYFNFSVCIV